MGNHRYRTSLIKLWLFNNDSLERDKGIADSRKVPFRGECLFTGGCLNKEIRLFQELKNIRLALISLFYMNSLQTSSTR